MSPSTMTNQHGGGCSSPWLWTLDSRYARRLSAAPTRRWLAVEEGRVWLTRSQRVLEPGEDVWLSAGQGLALPAGSDWVAEGWPEAKVVVLELPPGD